MELSIYLENHKIDTNEDSIVALTLCYSYLTDPTTIAGDYSKTIKIPGTVNNNQVFGQIWKLDREQLFDSSTNTSVYFNPSKRTDCKIYLGSDIFKVGYVQLNKINKDKGVISYEMTFYSELCNVLHKLMDSSLSDLNLPNKLKHAVDKNSVWYNIHHTQRISGSSSYLSDYMLYGLDNNGIYDNFEAGKWLTVDASKNWTVEDMTSNDTNFDSAMLRMVESNRLRPYLKMKPLLNQIVTDFNTDNDYKLALHSSFFNQNNPYYMDSVMSGKLYDTDNASVKNSDASAGNVTLTFDNEGSPTTTNGNVIKFSPDGVFIDDDGYISFDGFRGDTNVEFEMMVRVRLDLDSTTRNAAVGTYKYGYWRYFTSSIYDVIRWNLVLEQIDSDGNPTGSEEYLTPYMNADYYDDPTALTYGVGDNGVWIGRNVTANSQEAVGGFFVEPVLDSTNVVLMFPNQYVSGTYTGYIGNDVYGNSQYGTLDEMSTIYTNLDDSYHSYAPYNTDYAEAYHLTDFWPIHFYGQTKTRSGRYRLRFDISDCPNVVICPYQAQYTAKDITVNNIYVDVKMSKLTSEFNPNPVPKTTNMVVTNVDELMAFTADSKSYFKSFNGVAAKLSGQTGISSGSTVTYDDMIDTDITQGSFLVNYTKLFGLIYDTDDITTTNTIVIKNRNRYHKNYEILDWTDKIDYSQSFSTDPLTFSTKYLELNYNPRDTYYEGKYEDKYGTAYGIQKIDTGYGFNADSSSLIDNQKFGQVLMVKGEALYNQCPVASFFTKDNGERQPVDGAYGLMFMDDYIYAKDSSSSDDFSHSLLVDVIDSSTAMYNEDIGGSDQDCWLDVQSLINQGYAASGEGTWNSYFMKMHVNCPTTLKTDSDGNVFSFDLGYPRANYAKWGVTNYPSSATIYSKFWNNYISDLYDVNTKILNCYVKLTPTDIMNFSFKNFVKINDTLWHPNKITDYNPLSSKPVKVELVKVNNVEAYTNGQYAFSENYDIKYTLSGFTKVSGPTSYDKKTGATIILSYASGYSSVNFVHVYVMNDLGQTVDIASSTWDESTLTITLPADEIDSDIQIQAYAELTPIVYHSITYQLANCTLKMVTPYSYSLPSQIQDGYRFVCNITDTPEEYDRTVASVTMGGTDVTSSALSDTQINILSVTGDLEIKLTYVDTADILLPFIASGSATSANTNRKSVYYNTHIVPDSSTSIEYTILHYEPLSTADGAYEMKPMGSSSSSVAASGLIVADPCYWKKASIRATLYESSTKTVYIDSSGNLSTYKTPAAGVRRTVKAGFLAYEDQLISGTSYVNKGYEFLNIETEQVKNTSATTIAANCGNIYMFTPKANNTLPYDGTRIYNGKIFKAGVCVANFQPVLRYSSTNGWVPCMWDTVSDSYYTNDGTDTPYYDTDNHDDIFISYIGNGEQDSTGTVQGTCIFDITTLTTTLNAFRFDVVASVYTTTSNSEYYIALCFPGRKPSDAGSGLIENIVMSQNGYIKSAIGYTSSGSQMTQNTTRTFNQPFTASWYTSSGTAYWYVNGGSFARGYSAAITTYGIEAVKTLSLFKDPRIDEDEEDQYALAGAKIYKLRMYAGSGINDDDNCFVSLIPVLHYTGTPVTYTSDEGKKAPAGYEPCFYDQFGQNYYYASTGTPTFGFYS